MKIEFPAGVRPPEKQDWRTHVCRHNYARAIAAKEFFGRDFRKNGQAPQNGMVADEIVIRRGVGRRLIPDRVQGWPLYRQVCGVAGIVRLTDETYDRFLDAASGLDLWVCRLGD